MFWNDSFLISRIFQIVPCARAHRTNDNWIIYLFLPGQVCAVGDEHLFRYVLRRLEKL